MFEIMKKNSVYENIIEKKFYRIDENSDFSFGKEGSPLYVFIKDNYVLDYAGEDFDRVFYLCFKNIIKNNNFKELERTFFLLLSHSLNGLTPYNFAHVRYFLEDIRFSGDFSNKIRDLLTELKKVKPYDTNNLRALINEYLFLYNVSC